MMEFLLNPTALAGFKKFVVLQFETVWSPATVETGLVQGEVKAGTSHPDFGKGWEKLSQPVREFITRLCVMRSIQFQEYAHSGELHSLIGVSKGTVAKSDDFEETIAKRLHQDWVILRALLYTAYDDATRQALVTGGLKPFSDHEGDKPWEVETEAQQANDRRLVYRLGWLLDYCAKSDDVELKAYYDSLLVDAK